MSSLTTHSNDPRSRASYLVEGLLPLLDNFAQDPFGTSRSQPQSPQCSFARRTGKSCRRWTCGPCSVSLAQREARTILRGLQDAHRQGHGTRFITVTDASARPLHLEDFNRRCSTFLKSLRRAGLADHYIAALGVDQNYRLHRHIIVIGPYVHRSILSEHAHGAGLGRSHVKAIPDTPAARRNFAAYMGRNALVYALLHARSGARIQPFTRSRN